jgi:hypothetical protein
MDVLVKSDVAFGFGLIDLRGRKGRQREERKHPFDTLTALEK